MLNNKKQRPITGNIKKLGLISTMLLQTLSLTANAQQNGFDDQFNQGLSKQIQSTQFEFGIRIPLGGSANFRNQTGSSFFASFYLPGQNSQIGLGFQRSFNSEASFQFSSLFRNPEYKVNMSLPLYERNVANASSTGSGVTMSSAYLIAIGAGLILVAAASGGGDSEDDPTPTYTLTPSKSALQKYEETISLPVCSPIPPADGNEQPCRSLL